MKKHRIFLVTESLDLLRQVRAGLTNDLNRGLVVVLDEVIVKLQSYLDEGLDDPGLIADALKVLAQGLGTVSAIQRLIEFAKDR